MQHANTNLRYCVIRRTRGLQTFEATDADTDVGSLDHTDIVGSVTYSQRYGVLRLLHQLHQFGLLDWGHSDNKSNHRPWFHIYIYISIFSMSAQFKNIYQHWGFSVNKSKAIRDHDLIYMSIFSMSAQFKNIYQHWGYSDNKSNHKPWFNIYICQYFQCLHNLKIFINIGDTLPTRAKQSQTMI